MAYTAIDNPEAYFQVVTWTGNATDDRTITLPGDTDMQPDLVWAKERSSTSGHIIVDAVRGATKFIQSHNTTAEDTNADIVQSFETDGFEIGTHGAINEDTETYVAWCWKAGTSFSNDASATSVGSVDTTGSINTTAGISIMKYTGATGAQSYAHGLSAVPEFIIIKNLDSTETWRVYHSFNTAAKYMKLNTADAVVDDTGSFSDITPTSALVYCGGDDGTMHNAEDHIAYIFAPKQGFSKFGSYTGNGDADGTFVYTGFKPAWLLIKGTAADLSWTLYDNKRPGYNENNAYLLPDAPDVEASDKDIDLLSNGFKPRTSNGAVGTSGNTYIYMAFAEAPFVNSNGVPCNAR